MPHRSYRPIVPRRQARSCQPPRRDAHSSMHDPTPHATPGLRARPGRAGPALRHARLRRAGEYRAPKSRTHPERLLVVLPGACPRLQRRLGFLQRHDARRDRGAAARRHRLAAPDLAARPPRRRGLGRGRCCATRCTSWRPAGSSAARRSAAEQAPPELREPLATLGLSWPTTLDAVKSRYKELAKRHHPDANGGDRDGGGTAEDDQSRLCRAALQTGDRAAAGRRRLSGRCRSHADRPCAARGRG